MQRYIYKIIEFGAHSWELILFYNSLCACDDFFYNKYSIGNQLKRTNLRSSVKIAKYINFRVQFDETKSLGKKKWWVKTLNLSS